VQDLQVPTYVTSTFVQEEELIVELTQQVLVEAQLDEVDKIGTMVSSTVEEKTVLFATLHLNIDFVILDIFIDVRVPKALLLLVIPKVIPAFKHASSTQILIRPHFQTRGRVFSNQRSMMRHNLLHIVFWISILNFEFSFYCG
jgi:small nuclear ribonucleoprotein (snRNP)-like protein